MDQDNCIKLSNPDSGNGLTPDLIVLINFLFRSMPITLNPAFRADNAVGNPTWPNPNIPTVAVHFLILFERI